MVVVDDDAAHRTVLDLARAKFLLPVGPTLGTKENAFRFGNSRTEARKRRKLFVRALILIIDRQPH